MKIGNNLNCELSTIKSRSHSYQFLGYQKVIEKQNEVIESLFKQICLLKSYISLEKDCNQANLSCSQFGELQLNSKISEESTSSSKINISTISVLSNQSFNFINQLAAILSLNMHAPSLQTTILQKIKTLKETSIKASEPIFIERIKEVKVPITVETIVQKHIQKIVQKIVYVDREKIVEKIIERPIFKEKIIEKFVDRREENQYQPSANHGLNKTASEKDLRGKNTNNNTNTNTNTNTNNNKQKYLEKVDVWKQFGKDDNKKSGNEGISSFAKKRQYGNKSFGKRYYD